MFLLRYAASSGCSILKIYAILFFWRNANYINNSFCSLIRNQMLFSAQISNLQPDWLGFLFSKWHQVVNRRYFFHCYAYIINISANLSSKKTIVYHWRRWILLWANKTLRQQQPQKYEKKQHCDDSHASILLIKNCVGLFGTHIYAFWWM